MASWLDKAMGRESDEPQREQVPFEFDCDCGSRLNGLRQVRAKRVICPTCGVAQFVLPINQYPVSTRKFFVDEEPAPIAQRPKKAAVDPDVRLDDDDDDDAPQDAASDERASEQDDMIEAAFHSQERRERQGESPESRSPSRRPTRVRLDAIEVQQIERPASRAKVFLLVGVLGMLVLLMAGWLIRSSRRETAELRFKTASDAGLSAFDNGDFGKAAIELGDAMRAAQVLGLSAETTANVGRKQQHADALVRLTELSLFELVDDAERKSADEFLLVHRDRWVFAHAPVVSRVVPAADPLPSFVEWDLIGSDKPVKMLGLDAVVAQAQQVGAQEVLFSAQLKDCRREVSGTGWILEFKPGTGFLWQDFESLRKSGFVDEKDDAQFAAYRVLIERQAGAAGRAAESAAK